jgi:hypothetical protein
MQVVAEEVLETPLHPHQEAPVVAVEGNQLLLLLPQERRIAEAAAEEQGMVAHLTVGQAAPVL